MNYIFSIYRRSLFQCIFKRYYFIQYNNNGKPKVNCGKIEQPLYILVYNNVLVSFIKQVILEVTAVL